MSELVQLSELTFAEHIRRLNEEEPWFLSRWGDSEWRSVLAENDACWKRLERVSKGIYRKDKRDSQGHSFPPEMGRELRALLRRRPGHMLCIANRYTDPNAQGIQRGMGLLVYEWLKKNKLTDIPWYPTDGLCRALIHNSLAPFVQEIRRHPVLVVGPKHLNKLKLIRPYKCITSPGRDAYFQWRILAKAAEDELAKAKKYTVVSVSIGAAAALLVDHLQQRFGEKHAVIDIGSVWDPFVGVISRRYMRMPKLLTYTRRLTQEFT